MPDSLRDIYRTSESRYVYEGRTINPSFYNDLSDDSVAKFTAIGFNFLLSLDEQICPSHKKTTKDSNGNIKICPPVSAEEHLAVQRETKARTTLLTTLPDDHMGDFYHQDDAKEIWLAIKARFGPCLLLGLKSLLLLKKGGLRYLSFDDLYNKLKSLKFDVKGYAPKPSSLANATFVSNASTNNNNDTSSNHSPSYSTSSSYFGNREATSSHGSMVDDVIHSFLAESEPKQQLAYEDLKQIEKLDLEELDLKWQMAMLSIRVQKFEKKAGRKIRFYGLHSFWKQLGI
ncbi:hypothetical protein Tco_0209525 [Tanacetum coccineum]